MFWMWFWFCFAIALLVVEMLTADLVCIWFGAAALLTGVVRAIFPGLGVAWQFLIFVLVSVALLAATRPLVRRFMRSTRKTCTNLDRLYGRTAIVTERIDNLQATGAIRLGDLTWTARMLNEGECAEIGEYVVFVKIEGNKAFVNKKGE